MAKKARRKQPQKQWRVLDRQKAGADDKLSSYQRQIADHDNTCLFVIDEEGRRCRAPAIKGHSIPESPVLKPLRDDIDDKVLEFRWGMGAWRNLFMRSNVEDPVDLASSEKFTPLRVGTGDASVGRFTCERHDGHFNCIDVAQHDIPSGETAFLLAYRTLLYSYDLWRKYYAATFSDPIRLLVRNQGNRESKVRYVQLRELGKRLNPRLDFQVSRFGSFWYSREALKHGNLKLVATRLSFRSRLRFAASVMVDARAFATACPGKGDLHTLIVLWLAEDELTVRRDIDRLTSLVDAPHGEGAYGVRIACELLSNWFGSMAASPDTYDGLTDSERLAIQETIRDSNQAQNLAEIFADGGAGQE